MVDFHYFTDCEIPQRTYDNTIFHKTTLTDYVELINSRLGILLTCKDAHKLCDVKPFLGYLHDDLVKNYSWWGFSDIDLVYGDLSTLINSRTLAKYDIITSHIKCISGHFTIIRTKSKYTAEAFNIQNWKAQLETHESTWFDEVAFSEHVRTRKYRLIDKLWYSFGRKLHLNYNRFYHTLLGIIPLKNKIFMTEADTTFHPVPEKSYIYDTKTLTFDNPGTIEGDRIPNTIPYLHFLFFKKISYYDTPHYWKPGFYKIPQQIDWEKVSKIEITTQGIRIIT